MQQQVALACAARPRSICGRRLGNPKTEATQAIHTCKHLSAFSHDNPCTDGLVVGNNLPVVASPACHEVWGPHPACTGLSPSESVLAGLRLPAWSSVHLWLLCIRSSPLSAPALLPAPTPVLHMSAPVRRGAVADAPLGLA